MSLSVLADIAATFVKIFVMLAIGYILRKKGVIDRHVQDSLLTLLTAAVLPFSIFSTVFYDITEELLASMKLILIGSMLYYIAAMAGVYVLTRFLPIGSDEKRCYWASAVFANTTFVGLPLLMTLYSGTYGNATILMVLMYNIPYDIFFYSLGTVVLSRETDMKKAMVHIFKEPLFICCIVSLLLFVLQIHRYIPAFVQETTSAISAMTVPLSMIIIGSSLATIRLRELIAEKYAYMISTMRLIVFPLVMLSVLVILHIHSDAAQILVIMTALPAGSLSVIYAEQYQCVPEFSTKCVVQSTMFMILTIPCIVVLARLLI